MKRNLDTLIVNKHKVKPLSPPYFENSQISRTRLPQKGKVQSSFVSKIITKQFHLETTSA